MSEGLSKANHNNASNFATGGVLSVRCDDDLWHPVAFISKALNETERNYEIHDKEMLGIIRCLEALFRRCQVEF